MKVQKVAPAEKEGINTTFAGRNIYDEICLYNIKEKDAYKKRRIFFLTKAGIISSGRTKIQTEMFFKDVIGRKIIVATVREPYTDKNGSNKEFVKIPFFDGYEHHLAAEIKDDDFSGI